MKEESMCVVCQTRCNGDGADDPCGADHGTANEYRSHVVDTDRLIRGRSRRGEYVCGVCAVYDDAGADAWRTSS